MREKRKKEKRKARGKKREKEKERERGGKRGVSEGERVSHCCKLQFHTGVSPLQFVQFVANL